MNKAERVLINPFDATYHDLLEDIRDHGIDTSDRTGWGTRYLFGKATRYQLHNSLFPQITSKYVWFKGIKNETRWFISGSTNIRPLILDGIHIWDDWPFQKWLEANNLSIKFPKYQAEWHEKKNEFATQVASDQEFANKWGDLGPVYGSQWRNFNGFDQLAWVIENIKKDPFSRRHIVTAWNPPLINQMALPPCHKGFQFKISPQKQISTLVEIRSWDTVVGGPFNIAEYALLTYMVAQVTNTTPDELIIISGDTHIYRRHFDAVEVQLNLPSYPPPTLKLNPDIKNIDDFTASDIVLENYQHGPKIPLEIAV